MITPVHYLPILTTLLSIVFALEIFHRYRIRGGNHLFWWGLGVLIYGLGTFAEASITLWGWNPTLFRFWYFVGAILGGAPLAQGTVWFLLKPGTARRLTYAMIIYAVLTAPFIVASPINMALVDPHLPSGRVFVWQWIRLFSPLINLYAVIFLIGGAILSAVRFFRSYRHSRNGVSVSRDRFIGNVCIAVGALLPGIGGAASRLGHTEILYIMEITGLTAIWIGYWFNIRRRPV
ncbi:MAG: hypothetical protein GXO90_04825 [FCB group bacterium]|nr:hypothetical protein [FCB group bacterium]